MDLKIKNDNLIIKIEFILLVFLGISQILSISYLNLAITLCIGILFLVSKIDKCILMLFIALPFFNLFNGKIGSVSFYYLFIIIFIIKYFNYKKVFLNKNKILFLMFLLILRIPSGDFSLLSKWFLLISVLVVSYNEDFLTSQLKEIIDYFCLSFVISSTFGYYMLTHNLSIYVRSYIYTIGVGSTIRFAGLVGDSVFYGQFAALLIASCLAISFYSKNNLFRYIMCVTLFIFIVLTYSKTGIILAILSFIFYILALIFKNAKTKKNVIKSIFLLFFLCFSIYYGISYFLSHTDNLIIKNYITRFTSSDLLTGRNEVTRHYLYLLKSSWRTPFFAMAQNVYSSGFSTNGANLITRSHNIYIETLCAFGLIGTITIFGFVFSNILKAIKQKKNIVSFIPIIIMFLSGISLHGHFEFQYYFLIIIALAFLCNNCLCNAEK